MTQLGYFHGDDAYALDRAADGVLASLRAGGDVERWRVSGDSTANLQIPPQTRPH